MIPKTPRFTSHTIWRWKPVPPSPNLADCTHLIIRVRVPDHCIASVAWPGDLDPVQNEDLEERRPSNGSGGRFGYPTHSARNRTPLPLTVRLNINKHAASLVKNSRGREANAYSRIFRYCRTLRLGSVFLKKVGYAPRVARVAI
jgi:hypothetical protein